MGELVVDNFAGGGGGISTGIAQAIGRDPDIAINHDPERRWRSFAGESPQLPEVMCTRARLRREPAARVRWQAGGATRGSPRTAHFFPRPAAKKPFRDKARARRRRGLAGVVLLKWAEQVRPRIIVVENVEEFKSWGPLGDDGMPDPDKKGQNFARWIARLTNLGYRGRVEGAPRVRLRRADEPEAALHHRPMRRPADRLAEQDSRPEGGDAVPHRRRVHRLVDPLPQHLRPQEAARRGQRCGASRGGGHQALRHRRGGCRSSSRSPHTGGDRVPARSTSRAAHRHDGAAGRVRAAAAVACPGRGRDAADGYDG